MTPEQITEFVELCKHPAIAGKRGEWQYGDLAAFRQKVGIVKEIQVNQSSDGRVYQMLLIDHVGWIESQYCVWLPPVFDYAHPERGLCHMAKPITMYIVPDGSGWGVVFWSRGDRKVTVFGEALPIALAKCVIWQAEQEDADGKM